MHPWDQHTSAIVPSRNAAKVRQLLPPLLLLNESSAHATAVISNPVPVTLCRT